MEERTDACWVPTEVYFVLITKTEKKHVLLMFESFERKFDVLFFFSEGRASLNLNLVDCGQLVPDN